jgi:hypothetical protein
MKRKFWGLKEKNDDPPRRQFFFLDNKTKNKNEKKRKKKEIISCVFVFYIVTLDVDSLCPYFPPTHSPSSLYFEK